jgi:hypothetical protein
MDLRRDSSVADATTPICANRESTYIGLPGSLVPSVQPHRLSLSECIAEGDVVRAGRNVDWARYGNDA